MRNLKKVLSLSLALVMLLGMMVVGAGAADTGFADDASISDSFKEAAAINKALGLMTGDGTNLSPTGNIVRAEAYILALRVDGSNANTLAANWPVTEKPFNDVSTGKWYAPQMAYGKAMGDLNGNNGNYNPDGDVTVVEYAILLLKRLGFDPARYTGNNWAINAIADGADAGLFKNLSNVNYRTTKLTREQACQMTFNAITEYSPSGSTGYAVEGVDGVVFDSWFEAYFAAKDDATKVHPAKGDTLASSVWGLSETTAEDDFGRTVKAWNVKGQVDPIYVSDTGAAAPTVTYTWSGVKESDVTKATGAETDSVDADKVWTNGTQGKKTDGKVAVHSLCKNGSTVEVYASNKAITKVVVVNPEIYTVSKVDEKKNTFTVGGVVIDDESDFAALIGQVAKDDPLVGVKKGKAFLSLEPAEVVTGAMTAFSSKRVATIDGRSVGEFDGKAIDSELVGKDVTAVLVNGYAWSVTATEKAPSSAGDNYIWVTNIWVEEAGKYDTEKVAYAMGVLADGTVETLKLGNPNGTSTTDMEIANWDGLVDGKKATQDANKTALGQPFWINMANVGSKMADKAASGKFAAGLYYYYDGKAGTDMYGKALLAACPAEGVTVEKDSDTDGVTTGDSKISTHYISTDVAMVWINGNGDKLTASVTERQAIKANAAYSYVLDKDGRVAVIFLAADAVVSEDTIYVVQTGNRVAYTDKDGKTQSGYSVVSYEKGETEGKPIIATSNKSTGFYTAIANGEGFDLTEETGDSVKFEAATHQMYNGFLTVDGVEAPVNIKEADVIDLRGTDDVISTVAELEEYVSAPGVEKKVSLIVDNGKAEAVYLMANSDGVKNVFGYTDCAEICELATGFYVLDKAPTKCTVHKQASHTLNDFKGELLNDLFVFVFPTDKVGDYKIEFNVKDGTEESKKGTTVKKATDGAGRGYMYGTKAAFGKPEAAETAKTYNWTFTYPTGDDKNPTATQTGSFVIPATPAE